MIPFCQLDVLSGISERAAFDYATIRYELPLFVEELCGRTTI